MSLLAQAAGEAGTPDNPGDVALMAAVFLALGAAALHQILGPAIRRTRDRITLWLDQRATNHAVDTYERRLAETRQARR